jgi:hypothetical protein
MCSTPLFVAGYHIRFFTSTGKLSAMTTSMDTSKPDDFEDRLILGFDMMEMLSHQNLLIANTGADRRRERCYTFLQDMKLRAFDSDRSNEPYDYIAVTDLSSPKDIYSLYRLHNGKLVIFDTEKLLSRKPYLDVAEGGFCSSPDSGQKWRISYGREPAFLFKGYVVILTDLSKPDLTAKKEKFHYILRDMIII